jgi:signal transduction histidine kinase/CheY-like chemotaxis protein
VLSTPKGQVINTLRPFGEALPKRLESQPSVFPYSVTGPELSGMATGRISGQLAASLQVPVVRGGQVVMNVGIAVLPSDLQRLVGAQRLPADWIVGVLDSAGTLVARDPDPSRWVGRPASAELRRHLAASDAGFFEATSLEGRPSVAFFSKSPAYGWSFFISVPSSTFGNSLLRSVSEVAIGTLALLAFALIGAAWVARRLARPIYDLQTAARGLEQGEIVEARPTGMIEADEVGATLAQASRKIARSRAEMEERVAAAVRQTKDALEQLSQSQRLEALGQLTGGVAHDFNNLLAVIGNNTFVLQRTAGGGNATAPLAAITRAVQVGSRLTGHLLRFARRSEIRPEVIDLGYHLPSLTEMLKTALGSSTRVAMRVEPSTRMIECDSGELELALINLAVNSRDAMPSGGEFIVIARNASASEAVGLPPGNHVVIAVSDTGIGIAPDVIDQVFEPFFTTKGLGKGTGLGLSQVYGFCSQAGGTARILASSAAGTTVLMLLPATSKVSEPVERPPLVESAPAPEHRELLLVEDNDELGQATETLLTLFGYRVTRASSAEEAIEMLDAGTIHFDVVLSDVVMPGGMSGVSFAQYLQKNIPEMPVILITGYASHLREKHGFEILRKPCAPDVLLAALRRATAQPATA